MEKRIQHHTTDLSSIGRHAIPDDGASTVTLWDIMEKLNVVAITRGIE